MVVVCVFVSLCCCWCSDGGGGSVCVYLCALVCVRERHHSQTDREDCDYLQLVHAQVTSSKIHMYLQFENLFYLSCHTSKQTQACSYLKPSTYPLKKKNPRINQY